MQAVDTQAGSRALGAWMVLNTDQQSCSRFWVEWPRAGPQTPRQGAPHTPQINSFWMQVTDINSSSAKK